MARWGVRFAAAVVGAIGVLASAGLAVAQNYPTRPVKILVPYAAGGPSDVGARLLAESLSKHLGAAVIVENRGGAGGLTGTEAVALGEHDGYTLLYGAIGPLIFMPTVKTVRYDVDKDFIPLSLVWRSPEVLVVSKKTDVKTVKEFVAKAQAKPGELTVASAGIGTMTHMISELIKREMKIDLTHVPFRSTGAALPDLLSGIVNSTCADVTVLAPHVNSGALVGLAISSKERSPLLPDVPTMTEVGYPGVETELWYGVLVPSRTPPAAVEKLKSAIQAAVADQAFQAGLRKQGAAVETNGNFAEHLRREREKWVPVVKAVGLRFD